MYSKFVSHKSKFIKMSKTKWVLDPTHSELGFKIKHLMITNVSGFFNSFQVQVAGATDDDDFSKAKIRLQADMNSIHIFLSQTNIRK